LSERSLARRTAARRRRQSRNNLLYAHVAASTDGACLRYTPRQSSTATSVRVNCPTDDDATVDGEAPPNGTTLRALYRGTRRSWSGSSAVPASRGQESPVRFIKIRREGTDVFSTVPPHSIQFNSIANLYSAVRRNRTRGAVAMTRR